MKYMLFLLFLLIGLIISFIPPLLIKRYLFHRLAQKDSTEKMLHRKKICGYVQIIISFIGSIVIALSILLIVKQFHHPIAIQVISSEFICFILYWLTAVALFVYNQFIYYEIYKQIQQLEATKREALLMTIKYIIYITIVPIVVKLIYLIPFVQQLTQQGELMKFVILGSILFGASIFSPYLIKIIFNAIPLQDEQLRRELMTELHRHQLKGGEKYTRFPRVNLNMPMRQRLASSPRKFLCWII